MIKMVVSDMDGTLLNKDLKISEENLQAIKLLREQNIRFCIATGRPEQLVKEYIEPLQMEDPMILYNGSTISHPFKDKKLYELKLDKQDVIDICSYCEEHDIIYMPYTKDKIISKPNYRVDFFEERNKKLEVKNRCVFEDIRDINLISDEDVNKILLIEKDEKKHKALIEKYSNNDKFTVAASQKGFVDINPKGASKGNALKVLAKEFGYKLEEIAVFGDQDNDVSMLQIAGLSICMKNGSDAAKQASHYITEGNNESGFAKGVKKHILK